jgi:plastocyanin domain-containing protein
VGNTADVTLMLKDASNNTVTFLAPVNMFGGNLYVESPYAWTTSATSTLRASANIYINSNIDITGANAGLNILYGGTDGTTAPTATNFYQLNFIVLLGEVVTIVHSPQYVGDILLFSFGDIPSWQIDHT